jgi:peptidyl-prolyl cis-trans isomerase C
MSDKTVPSFGFSDCGFFASIMIVFVTLVFISGCSHGEKANSGNDQIYATVNGVKLTENDMRSLVPRDFYDRLTSDHKNQIIEEWIQNELLYQEALKEGIDREESIQRLLNQSRQHLLSNELLERRLESIEKPADEVLKQYYDEHRDLFELQANEYRVRYALFDNKVDADDFHRKVKRDESFSDLARVVSKDPSSTNGGDIGVINEEMVDPAIWEGIISTKTKYGLHRISDPFSVVDGWACIIIDEEYEAGTLKLFEHARELVYDMYMTEQREKVKKDFVERLISNADIKRFPVTE